MAPVPTALPEEVAPPSRVGSEAAQDQALTAVLVKVMSMSWALPRESKTCAVTKWLSPTSAVDGRLTPSAMFVVAAALPERFEMFTVSMPVKVLELGGGAPLRRRSEEHTSELQSLMRISYAVFCLKTKNNHDHNLIQL